MPKPYTRLYAHLVWATWDRQPSISVDIEERLHRAIRAEFEALGSIAIAIGGTQDHVHCLVTLPVTRSIAEVVKQVKGSTSHLVTHEIGDAQFKWQGSYSAFTIGANLLEQVRHYVLNQKSHHLGGSVWADWEKVSDPESAAPVLPTRVST